jgi:hypothetical protein
MVKREKRIVNCFECLVLVIVPTINVRDADRERQHEGVSPKQSRIEGIRHCEDAVRSNLKIDEEYAFEITSLRS